ncbi:MAG: hypothetical protein R3D30_00710 [Hyphomicrobiales bacterium]
MTKALIAAVAASLIAFGATTADARDGGGGGGGDHGGGGGGGDHGGGGGGGDHGGGGGDHGGGGNHGGGGDHGGGGGHHHNSHKFNSFNSFWWGYPWYSSRCRYEPRKVRVKVRDRRGRVYYAWVWRDVKVCY